MEKWTYHDNEEIEIHPVGDEKVGDHTIAVLCEDGYYNREIALKHARLIAAAPELLEACKLMQAALTEHHLRDIKKRFSLCVADAAMGKAITKANEH